CELRVLELDLVEPLAHRRALLLERRDPRHQLVAQLVPVVRVTRSGLLAIGDRRESTAQPLVFFQQLAGELRALVEQGEEILSARTEPRILLAHARPFPGEDSPPPVASSIADPTPRWIARAISSSGNTRSAAPLRITCCGMPKITAVCSDSAITRPPE